MLNWLVAANFVTTLAASSLAQSAVHQLGLNRSAEALAAAAA